MPKTLEQRISNCNFRIMRHESWCAFAGIVLMGSSTVTDKPITARVNAAGHKEYGRQYCSTLDDAELMAAVLHENLHFALQQLTVYKKLFMENPKLAGIAADYVVNAKVVEGSDSNFAKLKPTWYYDKKYHGWSVLQVYNELKKNPPPQPSGGGSGSGKPGQGNGQDEHDLAGSADGTPLTKEEEQAIAQEVDKTLRNGAYLAGRGKGNAKRLLGDLLEPKIRWQDQLQEFVQEVCQGEDDCTWRRPNRRFIGDDLYLPSMMSESMGELVIAPDTSGSTHYVFPAFIAELLEIVKAVRPARLRVIYWDDGITREEIYTQEQYDDLKTLTQPVGGGGTVITAVADYVKSLPDVQCAIILTDGGIYGGSWDGTAGWGCPTLWAITDRHCVAPVGKTVWLDAGNLY